MRDFCTDLRMMNFNKVNDNKNFKIYSKIPMESMNFLNKKYTSIHNATSFAQFRPRSSRTFLPTHPYQSLQNQSIREQSSTLLPPAPTNIPSIGGSTSALASNHCTMHPQQLIRHLCLDCIELLCSQCIGEHIAIHKENNSFPNIQTLKQLKFQMHSKLQDMLQLMFKEKNHPKTLGSSIDSIRKESLQRIDHLKSNLIQLIEQWVMRLKSSVMNNIGYEQIKLIQQQMYSLHEEVNHLINSLSSNNVSVHDIKKAYQIDADRLQKCYKEMLDKYNNLCDTMRVEVDLDNNKFIEGLEQAITLKVGNKSKGNGEENQKLIRINEQNSQILEHRDLGNLQLQFLHNKDHDVNEHSYSADVPLLFSLLSGTDILKIIDPNLDMKCVSHQLPGVFSYPLNSLCLLPEGMVVISGGIIAENKKSNLVQIYDYIEGRLITEAKLSKGRSSHKTIIHEDKIYFIGGFTSQNQQCKQIEVLQPDGLSILPHKCKWGGPNLCIKTQNHIIKITVSGVEAMNLQTHEWSQITIDVPFALSKGMQVANYINTDGKQEIIIFGDDQYTYKLDLSKKLFTKKQANVTKPIISATIKDNKVYGWVEDNHLNIITLDGQNWKNIEI